MQSDASPAESAREELERAWRTSDTLFEFLDDDAWTARPIPHRHPFVFYLGHLPAFAWNQIGRGVLDLPPIDAAFEDLFERGIDPSSTDADDAARSNWPSVSSVSEYRDRVRDELRRVLPEVETCERELLCQNDRIVHLVLEHELMHHETLSYLIHELEHDKKRVPVELPPTRTSARVPDNGWVRIPAGLSILGADFEALDFGWDNEFQRVERAVASFSLQRLPVTVGAFLEFVEADGYVERALWSAEGWEHLQRADRRRPHGWFQRYGEWHVRSFLRDVPLEQVRGWPVLVSQCEAEAYARWVGARLPTEAELYRAAYGHPESGERAFPWGDDEPTAAHGNFGFRRLEPVPVGQTPASASVFGIEELVGNGWEWTSTPFEPLPGFEPWMSTYPGYSADFFGGAHNVVFGAGWATHPRLLRKSFRNWYQRWYPYAATTFRCARG